VDRRIDWIGAVLFAPAICLILLGIMSSSRWAWLDVRTLGCVLGGLLLLAAWISWELRVDKPLINVRVFRDRTQALTLLATALVAAGMFGGTGYLVQAVLQGPRDAPVGLGLSPSQAGLLVFLMNVGSFLLAPVGGWVAGRWGARITLAVGGACGLVAGVAYMMLFDSLVGMIVSQVVLQGRSRVQSRSHAEPSRSGSSAGGDQRRHRGQRGRTDRILRGRNRGGDADRQHVHPGRFPVGHVRGIRSRLRIRRHLRIRRAPLRARNEAQSAPPGARDPACGRQPGRTMTPGWT
jgi:hypothetical protein